MIILSHPTGNANVRAVATSFAAKKMLNTFYTSIAIFDDTTLNKLSQTKPLNFLGRRKFDISLRDLTETFPGYEIVRQLSLKMRLQNLTKHEKGYFSIDSVYSRFDSQVAKAIKNKLLDKHSAVYCYEDAALKTFREAKKQKIKCLYDLPIGYWRASRELLAHEAEKWPEWSNTLTNFLDSDEKLEKKDQEIFLADTIYVASTFTRNTLQRFPGTLPKIKVIPYGFPEVYNTRSYLKEKTNRKLKLLFVGGLSQRKGVADLFQAVAKFKKHVTLTVIGKKNQQDCAALDNALMNFTWIPSLPHSKILEAMREHDVLVFPSLFEGFGLVITEAMSQGTPVITTERTIGPDLIQHNSNGWLIKAGANNELEEAIEKLLIDRSIIEQVGANAIETAKKRPWSVYGEELTNSIIGECSTI